jgi:hypothetical protein
MTHERCSELLGEYVRGELPRDVAGEVRAHLTECADCRAEEQVVVALAEPPGASLDDLDRARLHRALAQELFPATPANAEVAGTPEVRWKRWIAPALASAAAVLIVLLVVTGGIFGSGGDSADMGAAGSGASLEMAGGGTDSGTADRFEGAGGGSAASTKAKGGNQELSVASGAQAAYDADGPAPEFDPDAGPLTPDGLASIGRESALFRSFASTYTVADVDGLRDTFLRRLVDSSGPASGQARRCAETLPEEEPILPAYGATGTYDGHDALVLGFVTNDAGSASLDRYLMWVWAKGSCKQPVDTLFERIAD